LFVQNKALITDKRQRREAEMEKLLERINQNSAQPPCLQAFQHHFPEEYNQGSKLIPRVIIVLPKGIIEIP